MSTPLATRNGDPLFLCTQFLRSCVTLSEESADLFAQSPLPAFDLYMNQLRAGSVRQTASQCNDDAAEVRVCAYPCSLTYTHSCN